MSMRRWTWPLRVSARSNAMRGGVSVVTTRGVATGFAKFRAISTLPPGNAVCDMLSSTFSSSAAGATSAAASTTRYSRTALADGRRSVSFGVFAMFMLIAGAPKGSSFGVVQRDRRLAFHPVAARGGLHEFDELDADLVNRGDATEI